MKKQSRKLDLNRETLLPLQHTDVDRVQGGGTTTVTTSSQGCISAISAFSASLIDTRWNCK